MSEEPDLNKLMIEWDIEVIRTAGQYPWRAVSANNSALHAQGETPIDAVRQLIRQLDGVW